MAPPWRLTIEDVLAATDAGARWNGHLGFAGDYVHGGISMDVPAREAAALGVAVQVPDLQLRFPEIARWMPAGAAGVEGHYGLAGSGLQWHSDLCGFVTIQLVGRKEWGVARVVVPASTNVPRVDPPAVFDTHVLEPGDALWVPPHAAHRTRALTESLSVSLTFAPGVAVQPTELLAP